MTAEIERRNCRACGCPLAFVPGPNGKKIPLDERSAVYRIANDMLGNPVAEKVTDAYVTHFASCAKANDFSGKKK